MSAVNIKWIKRAMRSINGSSRQYRDIYVEEDESLDHLYCPSFSFLCFFFFRKLGVLKPLLFFSFFDDFSEADRSSLLLREEVSGCPDVRTSWPFRVVSPV